ncbi:MAG: hypothetical protein HKN36_00320 [Hellea sp.]|nr:hypothetical protein [Hellea sp.]
MKKSFFIKGAAVIAMTAAMSAPASAGCQNGSQYCTASSHSSSSWTSQGSYGAQFVPFSSSASMQGPVHLNGLGANEFLQPTSCPVTVNGLGAGEKVLGCYSVMKKTQRVQRQYVQVVHPVIYVRYPVPTPVYHVPVPVPTPVYYPVYHPMPVCAAPMMPRPQMPRSCGW